MKNAIFWDVAPCISCVNRRFGGRYRLRVQARKIRDPGTSVSKWLQTRRNLQPPPHAGSFVVDFSTLKMEAIHSSETSVHTRYTWRHIPEHGILQIYIYLQFFIYLFIIYLFTYLLFGKFVKYTKCLCC
jgi:hypothetical protein